MKVYLEQSALLDSLKIVARAVSGQNTLPVLGNVLLRTEGKKLHLAGTNLELSIKTTSEADVQNEGAITVPSKVLTSYVSLLKKGSAVELSVTGDLGLEVKTGNSKTKIKGISAEEFPSVAEVKGKTTITLAAEDFRTMVHEVAFAAQENSARPILSGVCLKADGTTLRMAATDSYRLSEKVMKIDKVAEPVTCVIPVRALLEADRLAGKGENVTLVLGENQAAFRVDGAELVTRLIEGTFPAYEQIIPKQKLTTVTIPRAELEMAVRRVSIFAKENNQHMKLDFGQDGTLRVMSDQTEVGQDESSIAVKMEGQANVIALNADYLLDALSAISTDEITFEMQEKMNPAVLRPMGDASFTHLIMPLKM